eukprot:scaffold7631_cov45-Cyclotella_meneghiniana.AAC.2
MPHWHMIGRLVVWLFLFRSREGRLSLTEEPSVQLPFLSVQAYATCFAGWLDMTNNNTIDNTIKDNQHYIHII